MSRPFRLPALFPPRLFRECTLRHFGHLGDDVRRRLFLSEPAPFDRHSAAATLSVALGATLYCPATRPALADDIRRQGAGGVASMILCLEDAIADQEVAAAERNLVDQLRRLTPSDRLPLLFVRVRTPEQITDLTGRLGSAVGLLSGFVFPKFTEDGGGDFLERLAAAEAGCGHRLFAMPVLESPELAHLESRRSQLLGIAALLGKERERVLAVRLGVTDLCSAYGLRRSAELTVYDVALLAGLIADVVNVLGRADGTGYVVTGPVWEHFPDRARGRRSPARPVEHDPCHLGGLLREVELDQANGLLGKSCIHPSQVPAVHARSVVTHEEYCDAGDILDRVRRGGGVRGSAYRNKMNEAKPHRAWAERVMLRAEVFGVAREGVGFAELLAACHGA